MNLDYTGLNANSVNLTDYRMINAGLAKVIVATAGNVSREEMAQTLVARMGGLGAPVSNSFRIVEQGGGRAVHVGFVRANAETRVVTAEELSASYKHLVASSNILMSNEDESLWDLKKGGAGPYLVRHGTTNLSALVEAATVHNTPTPKLARIKASYANAGEYVSFVRDDGETDSGWVLATAGDLQHSRVYTPTNIERVVASDLMIGIYPVVIPKEVHRKVMANISEDAKAKAKAYWATLYSYAPEYAAELQHFVDQGTSL